ITAAIASGLCSGIGEWMMTGGRIGGLLGNAAFFAGYLGVAFFATLLAAQSPSNGWRLTAYMGAVLQLVAIALSATRGTMLALSSSVVSVGIVAGAAIGGILVDGFGFGAVGLFCGAVAVIASAIVVAFVTEEPMDLETI
ncbi:MAG: hypothetical protein AAB114_06655, partial [Chloroflexota bacterium]